MDAGRTAKSRTSVVVERCVMSVESCMGTSGIVWRHYTNATVSTISRFQIPENAHFFVLWSGSELASSLFGVLCSLCST